MSGSSVPTTTVQRKQICGHNPRDRFSSLPEVLISYILSLLPTVQSARTSVLSKSWRYRWTSTTVLSFEDDPYNWSIKAKTRFTKFVDTALLLHDHSPIQEFRLNCTHDYEPQRVRAWIENVTLRQVPKLHLTFLGMPFNVPKCILASSAAILTELSIHTHGSLEVPGEVHFPRLKTLSFCNSIIMIQNVSKDGFLSFKSPKLEALTLRECRWLNVKVLWIDAPLLQYCRIENSKYINFNMECVINVSSQRLEDLNCKLVPRERIFFPCASTIGNAVMDVGRLIGTGGTSSAELVEASIRGLILKGHCAMEAFGLFDNSSAKLPVLKSLTKLVLDTWAEKYAKAFKSMLLHSPVLESLIFEQAITNWDEGQFQENEEIPCLLSHLEVVKFRVFYAEEKEIGIVKFLLGNARVLKELSITFCNAHWNPKFKRKDVKKLLRGFPKASASARLVFQSTF